MNGRGTDAINGEDWRTCLTDKVKRKADNMRETDPTRSETLVRKSKMRSNLRKSSDPSTEATQASCHSLHSAKSVTIHPEVTQYRYRHRIPR